MSYQQPPGYGPQTEYPQPAQLWPLPGPAQQPPGTGWNMAGQVRPQRPAGQRHQNAGITCVILGGVAAFAGLVLPHIPGYETTTGASYSVDGFRLVCSSGIGVIAQAANHHLASECNTAGLVSAVLWAVVVAGVLTAGAGVLLLVQRRQQP